MSALFACPRGPEECPAVLAGRTELERHVLTSDDCFTDAERVALLRLYLAQPPAPIRTGVKEEQKAPAEHVPLGRGSGETVLGEPAAQSGTEETREMSGRDDRQLEEDGEESELCEDEDEDVNKDDSDEAKDMNEVPLTPEGLKPWECSRFKCPNCPFVSVGVKGLRHHEEREGACEAERKRLASGKRRRGQQPKRPRVHRCPDCPYIALSEGKLQDHRRRSVACQRNEYSGRVVLCPICDAEQAGGYAGLQWHYENVHWVLPPRGQASLRGVAKPEEPHSIKPNKSGHNASSFFRCSSCIYVTVESRDMKRHVASATSCAALQTRKTLKCRRCLEPLSGYADLQQHFVTAHQLTPRIISAENQGSLKGEEDEEEEKEEAECGEAEAEEEEEAEELSDEEVPAVELGSQEEDGENLADVTMMGPPDLPSGAHKCPTCSFKAASAKSQRAHAAKAPTSCERHRQRTEPTNRTHEGFLKRKRAVFYACRGCDFASVRKDHIRRHRAAKACQRIAERKKQSTACYVCKGPVDGFARLREHFAEEHGMVAAEETAEEDDGQQDMEQTEKDETGQQDICLN